MVQGQSSGRVSEGRSSPEAEAFCTFACNILTPCDQKLGVSGHCGHQWIVATAEGLGCPPGGVER